MTWCVNSVDLCSQIIVNILRPNIPISEGKNNLIVIDLFRGGLEEHVLMATQYYPCHIYSGR